MCENEVKRQSKQIIASKQATHINIGSSAVGQQRRVRSSVLFIM